ncbi:MAG TPA: hypothetical protein PLP16_12620, partial [Smithellaceae bacterium]|nr:hypothetical protein [Smithellaceae bacterium]
AAVCKTVIHEFESHCRLQDHSGVFLLKTPFFMVNVTPVTVLAIFFSDPSLVYVTRPFKAGPARRP